MSSGEDKKTNKNIFWPLCGDCTSIAWRRDPEKETGLWGGRAAGLGREDLWGLRTLSWTRGGPVTFICSLLLFCALKSGGGSYVDGAGVGKGARASFLSLHNLPSSTHTGVSLPVPFYKSR